MKQFLLGLTRVALLAACCAAAGPALAQTAAAGDVSIAAVVNGQVITNGDVEARARLLALSTGLPLTPDAMNRLRPQITTQLIDETLQMQEINRRGIVVNGADIEASIARIEQGNSLPAGGLQGKMAASGVPFATLIAQIRADIGWQGVLHQILGPELRPTPGDIAAEKKALAAQMQQTQYHLAEIFIPVSDPADESAAQSFATTVISDLRKGAPFPIIAAQFSQADSALQGGDIGFVSSSQLDPATAAVVTTMPPGAISNPIRVPGGYDIVQLQQVRQTGNQTQTVLTVREVFAPFAAPIESGGVGPGQMGVINKLLQSLGQVHSCDDMAALNATFGNVRPADPGPVNLDDVTPPQFQTLLASLPIAQPSRPLVARDGVSAVMVCGRQQEAAKLPSDDDIAQLIVQRRVDLESQQLLADLRHRSIITQTD